MVIKSKSELGAVLRRLRIKRGRKVADVARRVKYAKSTLYNIESGRSFPSTMILMRLLAIYGAELRLRKRT